MQGRRHEALAVEIIFRDTTTNIRTITLRNPDVVSCNNDCCVENKQMERKELYSWTSPNTISVLLSSSLAVTPWSGKRKQLKNHVHLFSTNSLVSKHSELASRPVLCRIRFCRLELTKAFNQKGTCKTNNKKTIMKVAIWSFHICIYIYIYIYMLVLQYSPYIAI